MVCDTRAVNAYAAFVADAVWSVLFEPACTIDHRYSRWYRAYFTVKNTLEITRLFMQRRSMISYNLWHHISYQGTIFDKIDL